MNLISALDAVVSPLSDADDGDGDDGERGMKFREQLKEKIRAARRSLFQRGPAR
jgi:hypothetical protein